MGSLSNLFKYKKQIDIMDIDNPEKVAQKVWIRLLGDEDLKESYRWARIVSAHKRKVLRDETSVEYLDETAQLEGAEVETLIAIILAANENVFETEAQAVVERKDLPKIEEIAVQPDAPQLEEQERLDQMIEEIEKEYEQSLKDYVETKLNESRAALKEMPYDDVVKLAKKDLSNIQALDAFVTELNEQKAYRGTYDDEACKVRSFDSIEDFKSANSLLKAQVIEEYGKLEVRGDDIKN